VCAGSDCIWVRLIDWCACGNGHIIDLYSDAFRRLAPLGAGVVRVTVSW
jgi:rare lipoprotein A (peptidoglycan hydrolase)